MNENHICSYVQNGRRCTFPGSRTASTKPDINTSWYCTNHYEALDNGAMGNRIFEMMDNGTIMPPSGNWRDDMIDKRVEEFRKTNPEFFFHPRTESEKDDYQEMMMGYVRQNNRTSINPLPYDKYKKQENADESILTGKIVPLPTTDPETEERAAQIATMYGLDKI